MSERISRRRFALLAAAGGIAVVGTAGLALTQRSSPGDELGADAVQTRREATVTKRNLASTVDADGTLGYGDRRMIQGSGHGTVTSLPAAGAVIEPDQALYGIDGHDGPVLMTGAVPMWRTLDPAVEIADGVDVLQLENNLVDLGYADGLTPDDHFSSATVAAVKRWQDAHDLDETGRVGPDDIHFSPGPVRVAELAATSGGPAMGDILAVTATTRLVRVDLDARYGQYAVQGAAVQIQLADRSVVGGTVTTVAATATVTPGDQGAPAKTTIAVEITPDAAVQALDESPVSVAFTTDTIEGALAVPVEAVVAQADGTYAVEVIDGDGPTHLVSVQLGRFAGGWVQVTGDLAEGTRVVSA